MKIRTPAEARALGIPEDVVAGLSPLSVLASLDGNHGPTPARERSTPGQGMDPAPSGRSEAAGHVRREKKPDPPWKAWEKSLSLIHAEYRAQGLADMRPIPPPVTVLGPTRKDPRGRTLFDAAWAARTAEDYEGGVIRSVRGVTFPILCRLEAKATSGNTIRMDVVSEPQAKSLTWCEDAGGLSLVAVLTRDGGWICPWLTWRDPPSGRRTLSLNADDLDSRGARIVDPDGARRVLQGLTCRPDWLRAAKQRRWV